MRVNHHPSAELLAAYAASSLPLSQSLCVATHLEYCAECRQRAQFFNSLGGELLSEIEPAETSASLKDNVMDKLFGGQSSESEIRLAGQADKEPEPATQAKSLKIDGIPRALSQFLPEGYDELDWKRMTPSLKMADLCTDGNGARVSLLKIKPGGKVGHHSHLGDEFTLVLQGSFSDENGIYQPGDLMLCDGSDEHTPIASKDAECICLTVQDGPIQFTGFFSRLLNPLLRRSYLIN